MRWGLSRRGVFYECKSRGGDDAWCDEHSTRAPRELGAHISIARSFPWRQVKYL